MANWLKQATAASIALGPLVSATDGYSPCSMLTFAASDIRLSKNGASFVAKNESTAPSANEYGWWRVLLDTTDTGAVGDLVLAASVTGALPVWREFMILNASAYEAITTGIGGMTIKSGSVSDKTAYILAASSIAGSTIAASTIDGGVLALTAASQIWNAAVRTVTGGSVNSACANVIYVDGTAVTLSSSFTANLTGSALSEISSSVATASGVWTYATRVVTGGSVVATSGSVVTTTVLDKTDYKLSASQDAITWGQQTITTNTASQGALHIVNTNAAGYGMVTDGSAIGQLNKGIIGQQNEGHATTGKGQYNVAQTGVLNAGHATTGYGMSLTGSTPISPAWAEPGTDSDTLKTLSDQLDAIDSNIGASGAGLTALGDTRLANLDTTISSRLASVGYTAPDNSSITSIKGVTDKLDTALELDGTVYRYTVNALENGTSGSSLTAQEIRDAMKLAPTAGTPSASSIDAHLDDLLTDTATIIINTGGTVGVNTVTLTITNGLAAVEGARVWLTTDITGTTTISGTKTTNSSGQVTFYLDNGTYYVWCKKDGVDFDNPHAITVS